MNADQRAALDRVVALADSRAQEILEFAGELIRQPSINPELEPNPDAERPAQEWLATKLDESSAFDTIDELYFRQRGEVPINVLVTAHSKVTNHDEALAFTYTYGKAKVFQTLLGHSKESLSQHVMIQLLRRGAAWAAQ